MATTGLEDTAESEFLRSPCLVAGAMVYFARVEMLHFLLALACKTSHSIQHGQGLGLTRCGTGQIEANYGEMVGSFDDMSLTPELLRGGKFAARPHS